MQCPACGSSRLSREMLIDQGGLPHGSDGHGLSYEHTLVTVCQGCGSGYLEVLVHDCFDYEDASDDYRRYLLDAADMARLGRIVAECLTPLSPRCACAAHKLLRGACGMLPRTGGSGPPAAQSYPVSLREGRRFWRRGLRLESRARS